jgi:lysophospholipase L1-like esterase
VLGPMPSIGDPSHRLPAQIAELQQIIGTRHIDVLTVSVGADDIGFATLSEDLIENTYIGDPSRARILVQFRASLRRLPQHYAELAQAIKSLNPGQVLVTDYPDLTRNQRGKVAAFLGPGDLPLISRSDALMASQQIIPALDAAIATAAKKYDWSLVQGVSADFRTHGYPSTTPWIRTLGQSLLMQGDEDGTFHPNAAGHQDIALHLMETYMGTTAGAAKTTLARRGGRTLIPQDD